jgi:hypothetical protein
MHRLGNAMLVIGGENGRALEEIEKKMSRQRESFVIF